MLATLKWEAKHPTRWHDIGNIPEWQRAPELLEKRGVIEIWPEKNQYRLKRT
jgi:hypothetical protein